LCHHEICSWRQNSFCLANIFPSRPSHPLLMAQVVRKQPTQAIGCRLGYVRCATAFLKRVCVGRPTQRDPAAVQEYPSFLGRLLFDALLMAQVVRKQPTQAIGCRLGYVRCATAFLKQRRLPRNEVFVEQLPRRQQDALCYNKSKDSTIQPLCLH